MIRLRAIMNRVKSARGDRGKRVTGASEVEQIDEIVSVPSCRRFYSAGPSPTMALAVLSSVRLALAPTA